MERAEGVSSIKYHLDTLKARHGCLIGSKGDDLIRISVAACTRLLSSRQEWRYLSFHGLIQLIGDRTGIEGQTLRHNITGMKFIRKADEMNLLLHAFSGELHSEIAQQVNGLQTAVFSIGIGDCDLVFSLFQAGLPGKELREGRIDPEICLFFQQCAVEPDFRYAPPLDQPAPILQEAPRSQNGRHFSHFFAVSVLPDSISQYTRAASFRRLSHG